jgi:hypothetical protein
MQESFRGISMCMQKTRPKRASLFTTPCCLCLSASQCVRKHTQNALVPLQARVNHTDPVSTRSKGHAFKSNVLKPKLSSIIFKNPVLTAKKTQRVSIRKINRLILFKGIIAVYSGDHTNLHTLCKNSELWTGKAGGMYSYHWARKAWSLWPGKESVGFVTGVHSEGQRIEFWNRLGSW